MGRHFSCTACGKCCEGWLPLSIDDALAHADCFPLFLLWTIVRPGGKSYDLTAQSGLTLKLKNRKQVAVRITPISYVPTNMACPALGPDALCTVHETKPQRCRTMPISGNRAEADQTDLLIPKPGWECDISDDAPLVYQNKKIILRDDFQAERKLLMNDAKILQPFGKLMLDAKPMLRMKLEKLARKPQGGHVILNFSTLIPRLAHVDIYAFAARQFPVMNAFSERTKGQRKYVDEHRRYSACAANWQDILESIP